MVARDRDIRRRLRQALKKRYKWRTIRRLAIEAAVPEETALELLRADDQVRFRKRRDGDLMAGLIDRVRPRP